VSQVAGIAALHTKVDWLPEIVRSIKKNQAIIKDAIEEIANVYLPVYPSEGSMFVVDISATGKTPESVADQMLKRGYFIRPAEYTTRRFVDRYVRVSFAIPTHQVERFATVLPNVFEA
jgi:histidinol-phosphate/aromatic aminotransferase/cobyric acid decarboxylase-like protein